MRKRIRVTQVRSGIGRVQGQKLTLKALGLRKMGSCVIHDDTPAVRGMVRKVGHLVSVEETQGE